jgi:hypothetical protein
MVAGFGSFRVGFWLFMLGPPLEGTLEIQLTLGMQ